jgi:ribonucleoside-triphosphate reductase
MPAHISKEFVESYRSQTPPWGFGGLGEVVYLRTYSRPVAGENRSETWPETIQRVINGAIEIGVSYTQEEAETLFDHMFNLRCSVSGRWLWQGGTGNIDRFGGTSAVNCSFLNLDRIEAFEVMMDLLMLGSGVGYSVERSIVHELPRVKTGVKVVHERSSDADIIVPDSRQGWSRLLHSVLKSYFHTGKSFTYSTILVREFGAPLKTFGGSASGPGALVDGIEDICKVLDSRAGKKIRSTDALDIANIIGRIVVSGSARRSAQIAIGDPDDVLFLRAKNWSTGLVPAWRANSNNSIYADSYEEIISEFWNGYNGSGEPYGLINRKLARTTGRLGEEADDSRVNGVNPCGEIFLESPGLNDEPGAEVCNLATIFLPNIESLAQFIEVSQLLYMLQKQIASLSYVHAGTNKIVNRNMRLGQSITGVLQASPDQLSWLEPGYEVLRQFDDEWSAQQGFPASIKLTAIQPSGTLSLLPGVTPGVHPAFAKHYIRRVRFGAADPLVDACRRRGYKVVPDIGIDGREDHSRWVVEFPCKSPEGAILASEVTAIDQLEWLKTMQTKWADNAVSVTVYYRKEELPEIKEWLAANYNNSIKSVSFLLHSDHNFPLPPYEEISEEQYEQMLTTVDLNVPLVSTDKEFSMLDDPDCSTGHCPVR